MNTPNMTIGLRPDHVNIPEDELQKLDIVALDFWTTYEEDARNRGTLREVEWVRWGPRGRTNHSTEDKVERVKKSTIGHWTALKKWYDAWKSQREVVTDGTPLDTWPGISKDGVDVLRKFHLLTVEHLAEASDGVLTKIGVPSIRDLQKRAKLYLQNQDRAAAAARLSNQDTQINLLKAELESLRAVLEFRKTTNQNAPSISLEDGEPTVAMEPQAPAEPLEQHANPNDPTVIPARRGPGRPPLNR